MNTWIAGLVAALVLVALPLCAGAQATSPLTPDWVPNEQPEVWDFDSDPPGLTPAGWIVAADEHGSAPLCVVVDVVDMPVRSRALAIQPDASPESSNQAIAMDSVYRNLDMTVRMRPDAGLHEQGGGLIWRWRDPNNYYVCRYNPLDGTFSVEKVVNGDMLELDATDAARVQFEGLQLAMVGAGFPWDALATEELPAEPDESPWLTMRVVMLGPEINCYLNDELMLTVWDEEFPGPGLVGFWTKGDAATTFDDLQVTPLD